MLNFEQFQAHMRDAQPMIPKEGYLLIDGVSYFNPSLKSRKRVLASAEPGDSPWRSAVVFSERGNFLCTAVVMGLRILHPDYMGWVQWPFEAEDFA